MDYIANVVITDGAKINYDKTVRKCTDISQIDESVPTIIIGYKNAEKWIKDYNILKKWYPEQNLFWTFGKMERKYEYDDDIEAFYKMAIEKIYENVNYTYFNFINYPLRVTKRFIEYMMSDNKKTIYNENNKFLYIYKKETRDVIGLSLDMCRYIGIDKTKILNKIKSNKNNIVFTGMSFMNRKLREIAFCNRHYIPVFYQYFKTDY